MRCLALMNDADAMLVFGNVDELKIITEGFD
jgi:hypothetical protein